MKKIKFKEKINDIYFIFFIHFIFLLIFFANLIHNK